MKWKREGEVVPGGDIGGDLQATESWSVRYRAEDDPTRVVDVYFYGEYPSDADAEREITTGVYNITRCTDATICQDPAKSPGETEVWSDCRYDKVEAGINGSLKYVDDAARGWAVLHTPSLIDWDGTSEGWSSAPDKGWRS